jgi:hypothetical protein
MASPQNIRFGDLLVKLNLVSETDLHDALMVAPQFGLPIGRTLVLSGKLTESELEVAIELQTLINQRSWTLADATKVAHEVRAGLTPSIALKNGGVEQSTEKTTLGQLLLEAHLITNEQLDQAQKSSYRMGMQLGRVLVLNNVINHQVLAKALNVQVLLRDRKLSMQQALSMLAAELPRPIAMEAQQLKPAPAQKSVRFSEFLVLSGLLTEAQMMHALEASMDKQLSLAQTIMQDGTIPKVVFETATDLYNKVCAGDIGVTEATEQVHRMMFGDPHTDPSVRRASPFLGELLKMTGMVDDHDIQEAISLSNKYPSLIGKMLVLSGAIDEAMLIASLRCQFLLKHGYLTVDDAVKALQYSNKNKVSFDDAMDELGFRKHPHNAAI